MTCSLQRIYFKTWHTICLNLGSARGTRLPKSNTMDMR